MKLAKLRFINSYVQKYKRSMSMTIQKLMEALSEINPNAEVFTKNDEGNSVMFVVGNPEGTKAIIGEW